MKIYVFARINDKGDRVIARVAFMIPSDPYFVDETVSLFGEKLSETWGVTDWMNKREYRKKLVGASFDSIAKAEAWIRKQTELFLSTIDEVFQANVTATKYRAELIADVTKLSSVTPDSLKFRRVEE